MCDITELSGNKEPSQVRPPPKPKSAARVRLGGSSPSSAARVCNVVFSGFFLFLSFSRVSLVFSRTCFLASSLRVVSLRVVACLLCGWLVCFVIALSLFLVVSCCDCFEFLLLLFRCGLVVCVVVRVEVA